MFTGIVQCKTAVSAIRSQLGGLRLELDRSGVNFPHIRPPALGDSICVSGTCLTISDIAGGHYGFDVIVETLNRTTLGQWPVGTLVNIEPAVTADQPLGGHFMQGHVDAVGRIMDMKRDEQETRLTIDPGHYPGHYPGAGAGPDGDLMDYIIPKGSIAIDGVSLTIASLTETAFEVALIPTTLAVTTLGERTVGDRVNLEADILSKTVVHQLRRLRNKGEERAVDWKFLRDAGFVTDI